MAQSSGSPDLARSSGAVGADLTEPGAIDHPIVHAELQQLLLGQVVTTLPLVLRRADEKQLAEQMRAASATRAVIDQALGIPMGQRRITSVEAFAILRQASQAQNRKVRDIATEVIVAFTGHPPQAPRPFTDPR